MKCARKECKGVPIDNNKGQPSACVGLAFGPIANRVMSVGLVLEYEFASCGVNGDGLLAVNALGNDVLAQAVEH